MSLPSRYNSTNKPINRKVLLVANTSWYLYNFRLPLIRALASNGFNVALVAPYDTHTRLLEQEGFVVHQWCVARASVNPFNEISSLLDLCDIYLRERPDLVHHFTIKACLYGTVAAKAARIYRVINAITGLGHVFLGTRRRSRLLRRGLKPFYSAVFKARRSTVVFQNADDQDHLIQLGITDSDRARLIRGSGVDINHFQPENDTSGIFSKPLRVLFPSRLIYEKGFRELIDACHSLWNEGVHLDLIVAGALDSGNRSGLSPDELTSLTSDNRIHCLGHVLDMRALYEKVDIVVLPSWREGLSRALIEAAAMERPIITTDVPGCRDVVDHGRSGLLVPLRDPRSLALALRLFIENPHLARLCGKEARRKVMSEFQVSLVNQSTLEQYQLLFSQQLQRKPFLNRWF